MDALGPIVAEFAGQLRRLGVPLRTLEVEFGPSQLEVTLSPELGVRAADTVILLRAALKQLARRHGYHVTFMCRPRIPRVFSSGWHLHQSLLLAGPDGPRNAFLPTGDDATRDDAPLSEVGRGFLAGQLRPRQGGLGVRGADDQRLQAVPVVLDGAGPGALGAGQPGGAAAGSRGRRPMARRTWRTGSASPARTRTSTWRPSWSPA